MSLVGLDLLERKIVYVFNDRELLERALTHRSARGRHNERLEFLGDSVLGFVIAAELYNRFPKADEGQLTRLRASLVREKTLAEIANELNLGDHLILGSGELKSGGFRRASILSDALEAIIGAVYLDSDMVNVKKILLRWFSLRLESLTLDKAKKDPKTELQEWLQSRQFSIPNYQIHDEQGQDHNKTYRVKCAVPEQSWVTLGQGSSRRKAEQDSATKMLALIQQND